MAYVRPQDSGAERIVVDSIPNLTDLKVFWGPEICRLEYLMHLLETGRIKDELYRFTPEPQPAARG